MLTFKRNDSNAVCFAELEDGEIFREDVTLNNILIKTAPFRMCCSEARVRAVDLMTGLGYCFDKDDKVFRVNATLVEE